MFCNKGAYLFTILENLSALLASAHLLKPIQLLLKL